MQVGGIAHGGRGVAEQEEEHAAPGDDVEAVEDDEEAEGREGGLGPGVLWGWDVVVGRWRLVVGCDADVGRFFGVALKIDGRGSGGFAEHFGKLPVQGVFAAKSDGLQVLVRLVLIVQSAPAKDHVWETVFLTLILLYHILLTQ